MYNFERVNAGLGILSNDSPILDVAREVSTLIREAGLPDAIIGGVAVVLHGHVRTTLDVDIYTADSARLAGTLRDAGFEWDKKEKQFVRANVPVQIVTSAHVADEPRSLEDLQDIRTVSLADLINMKLRSGTTNILRGHDLGDVVGLMRSNKLNGRFTAQIRKDLRPRFRELLKALRNEKHD